MIDLAAVIAHTADLCRKPYQHAVVPIHDGEGTAKIDDLFVRIETRDASGSRMEAMDLELEIYRSGSDVNLMLSWCDQEDRPMLWQGQHPVWMHGDNGMRCKQGDVVWDSKAVPCHGNREDGLGTWLNIDVQHG